MNKLDLYLFTGNSSTGKSTAAGKLAKVLDVPVLDPDLVRREFGITHYDPKDTPIIMREIFARKITSLLAGEPVIIATPYVRRRSREQSYRVIEEVSIRLNRELMAVLIQCECSEQVAKKRIRERIIQSDLHDPPNHTAAWDRINAQSEPITEEEMTENPNFAFLKFNTEETSVTRLSVREDMQHAIEQLERVIL